MLIFDALRVPITRFRHPGVSLAYWREVEALESRTVRLRGTFPIPGRQATSNLNDIHFDDNYITFPGIGEYYFCCDLGAFKCLILAQSDDALARIIKIFAFVSKNIVHSRADIWLCMPDGSAGPFYSNPLIEKFFFSDQPLQLHCGPSTHFLATLLHSEGIRCRIVQYFGKQDGHIVLEAWDTANDRWVMLDPDWGLCVADKSGCLLSVDEITKQLPSACRSPNANNENSELVIVNVVDKFWNTEEFNLPGRFTGHITWTPSRQSDRNPAQPGSYFETLVRIFGDVRYETYVLDDVRGTASWRPWQE